MKVKTRVRPLIVVLLIICAAMTTWADDGTPQQIAHFDLMPKPALLPDGTLAAYFLEHRGPGLSPTPQQQSVFARYSKDEGQTWSEPQTLFDLPSQEGGFGYFVVLIDHAGEAHFFMLCDAGTGVVRARPKGYDGPAVEPIARQRLDVWYVRSFDARTRWSEPRRIWEGRAGDLQSVTQLRSGRILLPLSYYVDRSWRNRGDGFAAYTFLGQFDVTVLYSDDGGQTWHLSDSVLRVPTPTLSSYGAVEPVVIQLREDRVWMLIRTQMGYFYESFSKDGATWSPAAPSAFRSSDSPAGLVRLPDQRLVLLWNQCARFPYAQGGRRVLHGAISRDDGRSWQGYREVLRDPHRDEPPPPSGDHGVSYPFPTITAQGDIVFSIWVETGEGRGLYRFNPDWLEQTRQQDDFARDLEGWSTFGTRGVEVLQDERSRDSAVMRLKPVGEDWPTAAVWNFPMGVNGSLQLRVRTDGDTGEFLLLLTDHFSSPFDQQDQLESVYVLPLGREGVALPADRWAELHLAWDGAQQTCRVTLDEREVSVLAAQRRAGVCYLRLIAVDRSATAGALLVDSVQVEVMPPVPGQDQPLISSRGVESAE